MSDITDDSSPFFDLLFGEMDGVGCVNLIAWACILLFCCGGGTCVVDSRPSVDSCQCDEVTP